MKSKLANTAFFILAFLVVVPVSHAVVPSMWPFLQSIMSFLPQIVVFILVGISVLFRFSTWKSALAWIGRKVRTRVGFGIAAGIVTLSALGMYMLLTGDGSATPGLSADEDFSEWHAFRGGARRLGNVDGLAGPQDGQEIWSFREKLDRAGFASSPAVAGNKIYVGANNNNLYCFDASTGDVIWKYETLYEVFSSPAVSGNKVYFGEGLHYTEDASFRCVDAKTGEDIWSFPTTSHGESSPFVADGKVVFGAGKDGVYCLDAETGDKLWQYPEAYVAGSPAIYDGMVYFGSGYGRNGIYCLALNDGSEIWTADVEHPAWGAPAVWNERLYIGIGQGNFIFSSENPKGSVACLDARTGNSLWEYEIDDTVLGAIAVDDGRIYFGSRDSNLYCVDALSSEEIWTFSTGGAIVSSPVVVKGDVYFGSNDGLIYCVDTEDGIAKWEFDTSDSGLFNMDSRIISSPAVSKGKLYVGSMNFFFYCIAAVSG